MKTINIKKTIFTTLALILIVILGANSSHAQESEAKSSTRRFFPYIEIAPTFGVSVANSQDSNYWLDDHELNIGGGFHFGVGVDTKWAGLGTKGRFEIYDVNDPYGIDPGTGMLYSWDILEARLYVVDWFRDTQGKLRPYLLAGGGVNIGTIGLAGGQANLGAGIQYQITKKLYLGGEASYRPYFFTTAADAHTINFAAILGWRF